jgi:hypothetical protein
MAILITKDLQVMGQVPVNQLYMRLEYTLELSGKAINCQVSTYYNRESYDQDSYSNRLVNIGIKNNYRFDYDSAIDGEILAFLHNQLKELLTTDTYKEAIDPSTGEIIMVVDKPRFCDEADVSFVDL